MTLISIREIMTLYGVGRPTATAWAAQSGAALERVPKAPYRVDAEALEKWLKQQRRKQA